MIDTLPTPERMAQGDLVLNNGKIRGAGGQLMIDRLLERGILEPSGHRACVVYRYCFEAFIHHLGVRAFDYGAIRFGSSEGWQIDRLSAKDQFVMFQRSLEPDNIAALSWVVLWDNPYTGLDKVLKCSRSSVRTRLNNAINQLKGMI